MESITTEGRRSIEWGFFSYDGAHLSDPYKQKSCPLGQQGSKLVLRKYDCGIKFQNY